MKQRTTKTWIRITEFQELESNDRLKVRYMNGIAIVKELISDKEVMVTFKGGAWNGKEILLVRHQINKVL